MSWSTARATASSPSSAAASTGVDDVVLLPFDHLSCTDEPQDDAVRELQTDLLARLR